MSPKNPIETFSVDGSLIKKHPDSNSIFVPSGLNGYCDQMLCRQHSYGSQAVGVSRRLSKCFFDEIIIGG